MTSAKKNHFRDMLQTLLNRVGATAAHLEDQVRTPTGGEAAGNLSNTPLHLGDVGTEVYTQELNATLLENEAHIRDEAIAALDRLDAGTFGVCEGCQKPIPPARLEALPYARHCVSCAEKYQSGAAVNLNDGRPTEWTSGLEGVQSYAARYDSTYAAGTPGGGGPEGGLAGTSVGRGNPESVHNLEESLGSSVDHIGIERAAHAEGDDDEEESEDIGAYAGPAGGAVGGTPANKRSGSSKGPNQQ